MTDKNILIVEDEVLHAKRLINFLNDFGYEQITVCENAKETLETIQKKDFDIIFMDIGLEDSRLNGIALAKKIKEQKNIPIIFITSFSDETNIENSIDISLENYLVKPVSKGQLFATLKIALTQPNQSPISANYSNACPLRLDDEYIYVGNNRGDFDERVNINEFSHVIANNNYSTIHTDTKSYFVSTTLKEFLLQFKNSNIVQVNRSCAVNKKKVHEKNNAVLILDKNKEAVKIGRAYKENVNKHFVTLKTKKS